MLAVKIFYNVIKLLEKLSHLINTVMNTFPLREIRTDNFREN